jgi:hypothetical protein
MLRAPSLHSLNTASTSTPGTKLFAAMSPVEEGHKPRFGGRFSGTVGTNNITCPGSVNHQTNKKLDTENFLYKTDKGIIDTEIVVTLLQNVTTEQGDAPSTIGTLEMRSTSPDNSMFST